MATGYSGKPLWQKLGIREGMQILLMNAPSSYQNWLEKDIRHQLAGPENIPDLIHVFLFSKADWKRYIAALRKYAKKNSAISIWVSWYKRTAGIPTDITETYIRDEALLNGFVDVKVCAVSEEWSGLKLVVPLSKR